MWGEEECDVQELKQLQLHTYTYTTHNTRTTLSIASSSPLPQYVIQFFVVLAPHTIRQTELVSQLIAKAIKQRATMTT